MRKLRSAVLRYLLLMQATWLCSADVKLNYMTFCLFYVNHCIFIVNCHNPLSINKLFLTLTLMKKVENLRSYSKAKERRLKKHPVLVCLCACVCHTPDQTKNDTDLKFGTHPPPELPESPTASG